MLDPDAAFETAFGNDESAMPEIRKIVAQLEATEESSAQQRARLGWEAFHKLKDLASSGDTRATALLHKVMQALETQKHQQQLAQEAEKKGMSSADAWLQGQLEVGARERDAAKKSQEVEAAKTAFKLAALAEAEAREALLQHATEAHEILLEEAEQAARHAKIKLEGLSALRAPVQPLVPGSEIDDLPILPPLCDQPKTATASASIPELYEMLGVGIDATFDEIKRGYRRQALQWHPDKNQDNLEIATRRFQRINEAFEVLFDAEKRTAYDAGQLKTRGRTKKLQGHGWSKATDEDDSVLTPWGIRLRQLSWNRYVLEYGRLDDDPDLVTQLIKDETDPRAAVEKIKLFWRYLAEEAYKDKSDKQYLLKFIRKVWKDTPTKWPGALELQTMGDAAQQEWKERRTVFNRRKEKLLLYLDLHEAYLRIPGREQKEKERIFKRRYGANAIMPVQMPSTHSAKVTVKYNPEAGCNHQ